MRRKLTLPLAICVALAGTPALAQMAINPAACGNRKAVTDKLVEKYGELQRGAGMVSNDRLLELWRSEKTGSWTILMTRPDGLTCIMAAGNYWRDRTPEPESPI